MSMSLRVSSMLVMVLTIALGLTALLSYVKFEKALSAVVLTRHQVTVRGLVDGVDTGLNLGLTLPEIQNYRQLVERAASDHADLLVAEVVDHTGRIVFSHAQADLRTGTRGWRGEVDLTPGWTRITPNSIALAEPLVNPFGQRVGVLVVEFSRRALDQALRDGLASIAKTFGLVLAGGAVVSVLLGMAVVRPFNASLDQIEGQLARTGQSDGSLPIQEAIEPVKKEIELIRARLS